MDLVSQSSAEGRESLRRDDRQVSNKVQTAYGQDSDPAKSKLSVSWPHQGWSEVIDR